jgi:signal transduction histidine kinase
MAAVTALGAVAATALLALLRLGAIGPSAAVGGDELLPLLIAAGLLCVIGLARREHPTVAWIATIAALAVVTIDLASYARVVRPTVDAETWRWLSVAVSVCALLGGGAAAGYASSRPRLRSRWVAAAGILGVAAIAVSAVWALANPDSPVESPLGSLSVVTRSFLVVTLAFTVLGIAGDLLSPADRAARRAALTQTGSGRPGKVRAWMSAFVDELAPGRTRARRAVLDERSRIARDLHADVVPGLRRALAEAERDATPEQLAASLREILAEVEAIGTERHAIQLEIGGLVPALAWLAERTEERSDVRVTLDVVEGSPASTGAPPAEVAAVAFRVAHLALDNVVRHAPGSLVGIEVRADPTAVDLAIRDDGPGLSDEALARARDAGRRGLADMAVEAAACDADVAVGPGPGGIGTCVTFRWRGVSG